MEDAFEYRHDASRKTGTSGRTCLSRCHQRSLKSGCLQTLITSASGPFLSHDDANIDAYRHLIPGRRRSRSTSIFVLAVFLVVRFYSSFSSNFLLRRLSWQIYQARFRPWKPMETYLSGCPDDAKSNFVRRQHVSRLSKVRVDDENVPPGHDWISGGRHCSRRIESTGKVYRGLRIVDSRPISDP